MILVPAIDLLDGDIVRLNEGDFARKTVFTGLSAIERLQAFATAGAKSLHLVDLSGARNPIERQIQLIESIVTSVGSVGAEVQVGGGVRELDEISALLATGAKRVVLGSLVVSKPELALRALEKFGADRLTFALDVRLDGSLPMVMSQGWQTSSGQSFDQVAQNFLAAGLQRVLCTDIARDGMMQGPNVELYRALVRRYPTLQIQASGGVSSLADLTALKASGVHSVIVGRALLSGAISIDEALQYAK